MAAPRPVRRLALTALLPLPLAGCADDAPSALDPAGPRAAVASTEWWILFGVAAFVCVVVIAMAVLAVVVRRRATTVDDSDGKGFVMVFGVVLPALVLTAVFVLSLVGIQRSSEPETPAGDDARTTIEVIGHQWWWEVRYEGTTAVTANEIHVPVGQPVRLRLSAAEVIHSFWVPELMPKTDLLPGRVNETWLQADEPGRYRGQCAEFCGLQHTHMAFSVVAQEEADFEAWLEQQASDAVEPSSEELRRGHEVVTAGTCATCHTVRGTSADGTFGPDLTHVASRERLAAGAIPNDKGHLAGWISNSQTIKPGNLMPPQHLSPEELTAVVSYLRSLE